MGSIIKVFTMMVDQPQQLQVVPAILLLQVILMVRLLKHFRIVTVLLLQIVITRRTYYPSITMVFIITVAQAHQVTKVPAIQLLLLILMVLLVTHPLLVMLQQQGQDLSLAVTQILRLTSCLSISSLRSPLV